MLRSILIFLSEVFANFRTIKEARYKKRYLFIGNEIRLLNYVNDYKKKAFNFWNGSNSFLTNLLRCNEIFLELFNRSDDNTTMQTQKDHDGI